MVTPKADAPWCVARSRSWDVVATAVSITQEYGGYVQSSPLRTLVNPSLVACFKEHGGPFSRMGEPCSDEAGSIEGIWEQMGPGPAGGGNNQKRSNCA
jgi:hypothetical protein